MIRLRFVSLACSSILALGAIAACGGGPTAPPESPEAARADAAAPISSLAAPADAGAVDASPPPRAAAEAPLPTPGPPEMKVLDPGTEPRKQLRYTFQKRPETMQLDMKMSMTMNAGGRTSPKVTMPTIRLLNEIVPVSVDPSGTLTATFEAKKVEVLNDEAVPDEMRKKLTSDMKTVVGLKGRTVVTARGVAQEVSIEAPPESPESVQQIVENLKDSLRNLALPLPEEAVGKGARWEVRNVAAAQMTTVQTSTYTLRDVQTKKATMDMKVALTAPPQDLHPAKPLPPGTSVKLVSQSATGDGTVTVSLDRCTPTSSVKIASSTKMDVTSGEEHQVLGVEATIDVKVKPVK